MSEYPLISALMLVNHNDHPNIERAINCFERQTYPYKELLIINNCDNSLQNSELNIDARSDVFIIDTPIKFKAGMARNFGLSSCNGQVIVQFDCDCFHAPDRLLKQAIALFENNASVCVLTKCFKYSYISNHASMLYNDQNAILNSMMFLRPQNIDYDNTNKQEEKTIMQKLLADRQNAISLPMPQLMIKLIGAGTPDIVSRFNLDESQEAYIKDSLLSIS